jgi:hypothetical protein
MLSDFLKNNITSQAGYVEYGYGQVEPNHLSAQRNAQIYAQLPAAADIKVLEQGQFVKYDYAEGVVDFAEYGEWMMVYNEIKLYRDHQNDCEFAMIKDNYQARIYSPFGNGVDKDGNATIDEMWDRQSRFYNATDAKGNGWEVKDGKMILGDKEYSVDDVTAAPDMYELHYNEDPFHILGPYKEARMPAGTTMVPRVFKTMVGDIMTTNTVFEKELKVGDILSPRAADGILSKEGDGSMSWMVVKLTTMPDHQKGVKLQRIA